MTVYIAKETKPLEETVRQIFDYYSDSCGWTNGVLLKPNIVFPVHQRSGQITRLKLVEAVINVLREKKSDIDIVIGEGTAAGTCPEENFKVSGFARLAEQFNVPLINFDTTEHTNVDWHFGRLELPTICLDRFYINLPILKISSAAVISGAMKNQKGLILPEMKKQFHRMGLHEPLAHLNKVIQPNLTIMDGANFFKDNIFISGINTCEIDTLATQLLQCPIPDYLKIAGKIGAGTDTTETAGLDSQQLHAASVCYNRPYRKFLRLRMWSNPRTCSMCREAFLQIKNRPFHDIPYTFKMVLKLLKYAFTGAEILSGAQPRYDIDYDNVICLGNCTKALAHKHGYVHVPGCPPTRDDILKTSFSASARNKEEDDQ